MGCIAFGDEDDVSIERPAVCLYPDDSSALSKKRENRCFGDVNCAFPASKMRVVGIIDRSENSVAVLKRIRVREFNAYDIKTVVHEGPTPGYPSFKRGGFDG